MTEEARQKLIVWEYLNKNPYFGGRAKVEHGIVKNIQYWSPTLVDLPEIKVKKKE